ncbi:MAG: integrase [Bacilli bacterium]|nr:integrase [Bacilli bacterium]
MDMVMKRRNNTLGKSKSESVSSPPKQVDFHEVLKSFILECKVKNLSKRTIQFYEENLNYLVKVFEAQGLTVNLTILTYRDIKQKFIGYMFEKGLASNTLNGRIKTCKAFFKYSYKEGFIVNNIADELDLVKSEKLMIQTFTKEQILNLLNQPNRNTFTGLRDYTIMMLLFETGMRIGELTKLKLEDVNFKEHEIRIVKGKGGKPRRVPFQKTCSRVLKTYLEERKDVETNALFITVDNEQLGMRTIQENIQTYGRLARISGVRVSPHTFRHTMAKFYIFNGGDIFTLQQILGHSTIDMVRYYVELFSSDIKDQHQKYSPVENLEFKKL